MILGFVALVVGLGLGCGSDTGPTNPSGLEFSTEGPPKRDGVKGQKGK
jgi:hypothetical protein